MKKYRARINRRCDCDAVIEEVEVEKETDKSVWINGQRSAKHSDYANYYDSWDIAHAALLAQQKSHVQSMRRRLERSTGLLGNIKGMHKP